MYRTQYIEYNHTLFCLSLNVGGRSRRMGKPQDGQAKKQKLINDVMLYIIYLI